MAKLLLFIVLLYIYYCLQLAIQVKIAVAETKINKPKPINIAATVPTPGNITPNPIRIDANTDIVPPPINQGNLAFKHFFKHSLLIGII